MSLAYWRDICILNLPEIDEEHADLLRILKAIYQDIQIGEDRHRLQSKLHLLFDSALSHCESEERLMESYGYPDYQEHADRHEELLNTVLNLHLKAEEQDGKLTLDMLHGIVVWLNHHFWDYDLKLAQFIQQRQHRETLLFS
jgi:hemerythrin-like metal-binding protein